MVGLLTSFLSLKKSVKLTAILYLCREGQLEWINFKRYCEFDTENVHVKRICLNKTKLTKQKQANKQTNKQKTTVQNTHEVSFDADEVPSPVIGRRHIKCRDIISDERHVRPRLAE